MDDNASAQLRANSAAEIPDTPAPADCQGTSFNDDVLSFFQANSAPAPPPQRWPFLAHSENVRTFNNSLFDLELQLRTKFGEQKLKEAGILDDRLKHAAFAGDVEVFDVALDATNRPAGICTVHGTIFLDQAPAIGCALARAVGTGKPERVYVVETIEDLQVLRGIGLKNAVLFTGLQDLDVGLAKELFRNYDDENTKWKYRSVLVDWNVCNLTIGQRPRMEAIHNRLASAQRSYNYDPTTRFGRWRADKKVRDDLADAQMLRDLKRLRKLINESVPAGELGKKWDYHIKTPPITYLGARSQLERAINQSQEIPRVSQVNQALQQFRAVFRQSVLADIYQQAERVKAPLDTGLFMQAAEVLELWFETQTIVQAAKKILVGEHPDERRTDDMKERLQLTSMLVKIRRSLI